MRAQRIKAWVKAQTDKRLDGMPFGDLPLRLRVGIFLIVLSYPVSYCPAALLLAPVFKIDTAWTVFIGAAAYLLGWGMGIAAFWAAGPALLKYPPYFAAKLLAVLFRVTGVETSPHDHAGQ